MEKMTITISKEDNDYYTNQLIKAYTNNREKSFINILMSTMSSEVSVALCVSKLHCTELISSQTYFKPRFAT
jgi:hypothetical protein